MPIVKLTPVMVLAACLLFMVKADGEIDDQETSQLQSVIGGNEDLLDWASNYTETVSLDDFLAQAKGELHADDVQCILANLCDSMLSDGIAQDLEMSLFRQIQAAFDIDPEAFEPTYKAIAFKNNLSILGTYSAQDLTSPTPSPHLAMASLLLFMMAADGDISEEEIGQLQASIGQFEGLQAAAMQQVRNTSLGQFLRASSPSLSNDQKLMILTMVADSMMSDGSIGIAEQNLFDNIQSDFRVSKSRLSPFLKALEVKNLRPFSTDVDPLAIHTRRADERKKKSQWTSSGQQEDLGETLHRTMDRNVQEVEDGFRNQADIDLVTLHSQQLEESAGLIEGLPTANLQKVGPAGITPNLQNVGVDTFKANVQALSNGGLRDNLQGTGNHNLQDNLQPLDEEVWGSLATEWLNQLRLESLQANIHSVHDKLDRFKPTKGWQDLNTLLPPKRVAHLANSEEAPSVSFDQAWLPPSLSPQGQAQSDGDQSDGDQSDAVQAADAPAFLAEEEESTLGHDQGGIRVRTLLLVLCISMPMVILAYGLIFPTLNCQGTVHRVQHWHPEGAASQTLLDETNPERQLMQIRRGEINLNNQRFPLYKELNPNNHIAMQTNTGFRGVYSTYAADQMNYAFDFDREKGELKITTRSSGVRFIDGQSGKIDVLSDFIGRCDNRWY